MAYSCLDKRLEETVFTVVFEYLRKATVSYKLTVMLVNATFILVLLLMTQRAEAASPILTDFTIEPSTLEQRKGKETIMVSVQISDVDGDLEAKSVKLKLRRQGKKDVSLAMLNDKGKSGDKVAGDGVFTQLVNFNLKKVNDFQLIVLAKDKAGNTAESTTATLSITYSSNAPVLTNLLAVPLILKKDTGRQTVKVSVQSIDQDGDLRLKSVKVKKLRPGKKAKTLTILKDKGKQGDEIARDGQFLGQFKIQTAKTGPINLIITAEDKAGHVAKPFEFTIEVIGADDLPPMIIAMVDKPANSAGWNNTHVTVSFDCSDTSNNIASCPDPIVVDTEGAGQVISGTAEDNAGNTATASVTVNIDKTPPQLSISSPQPNAAIEVPELNIIGTVTDLLSGVAEVTCDGIPATLDHENYSCDVTLIEGANTVEVKAMDIAGNQSLETREVTFDSNPDPPPVVSITNPANMHLLSANSITVSGTVDKTIATLTINGIEAVLVQNSLPTSFTAEIPLSEGNNTITAVAEDASDQVGSATIQVMRDTTAPRITIDAPVDGATVFNDTVNVTGMVNDIIGGSASDVPPIVTVNGIQASVVNRSFLAQNVPLVIGNNSITVVATDQLGNSATSDINTIYQVPQGKKIEQVSGQQQRSQIVTVLPEQLLVKVLDENSQPVANTNVVFRVIQGDGMLGESPNEARGQVITTDSEGNARIQFRLGSRAGEGNHRIRAKAVGFDGEIIFNASAIANPGDKINILSGDRQSGVTNRPLPHELTVAVTDNGANMISNSSVRFEVTVGGGVFANGESVFDTVTDNNGVASALWTLGSDVGRGIHRVTATLTGTSSFAGFVASGFVAGMIEETTISGVVLNNQDTPMPGVTIQIKDTNLEITTDAEGQFLLSNTPVGTLHLIANGNTTTLPGVWPTLSFEMVTIAGVENTLPSPVYLLPLDTEGGVMAGAEDVELTLPEVPGFKLTVKAGTVTFPDGAKTGLISVTPVNANKVPMPPPNGMQPQFIVTIQPAGAVFDPPAPLTLPNVDGHPPGAEVEMYSFDHDLEAFVTIGLGTVSADGSVIESNSGIGVLKAGWHCGSQPGGTGCLHNCEVCVDCKAPECLCTENGNTGRERILGRINDCQKCNGKTVENENVCQSCGSNEFCDGMGICKPVQDICPQLHFTYTPLGTPLNPWVNCNGILPGNSCGFQATFLIASATNSCGSIPLGTPVTENQDIMLNGCGFVNKQVTTGNGGSLGAAIDTFSVCFSNLLGDGLPSIPTGPCTVTLTQRLTVGQCTEVRNYTFNMNGDGTTCNGNFVLP